MGADNLFTLVGSTSWIAKQPHPLGIVEFIGGVLLGSAPIIGYDYFLRSLYEANYTVIATSFRFGLDHEKVAESLIEEHERLIADLDNEHKAAPRFWVGHSLGCKYIVLLEASGKIMNQPSLLIAPDISDTREAVPLPLLPELLDSLGIGVKPTRKQVQKLLKESGLYNLTALISFTDDDIAGTLSGTIEKSDVVLFVQELESDKDRTLLKAEITGGHNEIAGLRARISGHDYLIDVDPRDGVLETTESRQLEPMAISLLAQLTAKLDAIKTTR
jgi:hypothetical protein